MRAHRLACCFLRRSEVFAYRPPTQNAAAGRVYVCPDTYPPGTQVLRAGHKADPTVAACSILSMPTHLSVEFSGYLPERCVIGKLTPMAATAIWCASGIMAGAMQHRDCVRLPWRRLILAGGQDP